jgi:hypothetical protein
MDTSTGPPTIASRDRSRRYRSVGYWVATALVAIELGLGGIWDIARIPYVRNLVTHLGYPSYFLVLLGCWKVLGAVALLVPRRPLLKEWAYAGAFFTYTGAIVSHLTTGYDLGELPLLIALTALTVLSWTLRPPAAAPTSSWHRDTGPQQRSVSGDRCRHCAAAAPSRTCLVSPASSRRVKRRRAVT